MGGKRKCRDKSTKDSVAASLVVKTREVTKDKRTKNSGDSDPEWKPNQKTNRRVTKGKKNKGEGNKGKGNQSRSNAGPKQPPRKPRTRTRWVSFSSDRSDSPSPPPPDYPLPTQEVAGAYSPQYIRKERAEFTKDVKIIGPAFLSGEIKGYTMQFDKVRGIVAADMVKMLWSDLVAEFYIEHHSTYKSLYNLGVLE